MGKPVSDNMLPTWNLALVLDVLRKEPFEPLSTIPLSHLTVKTLFLLALSSGVRRSEMHALVHDGAGVFGNGCYFLQFDKKFIAKTAKAGSERFRPLVIPALPYKEDRALCPVRAD